MTSPLLRRLQYGEPHGPAEIGLRGLGLVLLAGCAALARWLFRCAPALPPYGRLVVDAAAAATILCWSLGWALVAMGPGLFRLMPAPTRHAFLF